MSLFVLGILFALWGSSLQQLNVQKYLRRYGHFAEYDNALMDTKSRFRFAISSFQETAGLPRTGALDEATFTAMQAARCGLPDHSTETRHKRYAVATKWRRRSLSYAISHYSNSITTGAINGAIDEAFAQWADASGIILRKVNDSSRADIILYFLKGSHKTTRTDHHDDLSFDGPGGVLAHASFPTVGEIHFDDAELWDSGPTIGDTTTVGYNLQWAALHEIGHVLGLLHSTKPNNIMNPLYLNTGLTLGPDDIAGIRALYGKPAPQTPITVDVTSIRHPTPTPSTPTCDTVERVDSALNVGRSLYFFSGSMAWRVKRSYNESEELHGVPISTLFPGMSGPITATFQASHSKVVFFRDTLYWMYDLRLKRVDPGYPLSVYGLLGRYRYSTIRAAFTWPVNRKGYIFSDGIYWRYHRHRIERGYPKATTTWKGLPESFDAMVSTSNGETFIFKDKHFWEYNNTAYDLVPGRKPIRSKWKLCHELSNEVESLQNLEDNSGVLRTSPFAAMALVIPVIMMAISGV